MQSEVNQNSAKRKMSSFEPVVEKRTRTNEDDVSWTVLWRCAESGTLEPWIRLKVPTNVAFEQLSRLRSQFARPLRLKCDMDGWSDKKILVFFQSFLGHADCPLRRLHLRGVFFLTTTQTIMTTLTESLVALASGNRIRRVKLDLCIEGQQCAITDELLDAISKLPVSRLSVHLSMAQDTDRLLHFLEKAQSQPSSRPLKNLKLTYRRYDDRRIVRDRRFRFPDLEFLTTSGEHLGMLIDGRPNLVRTFKVFGDAYLCMLPFSESSKQTRDIYASASHLRLQKFGDLMSLGSSSFGVQNLLATTCSSEKLMRTDIWESASVSFVRLTKLVLSNLDIQDRGDWLKQTLGPVLRNIPSLRKINALIRNSDEFEQLHEAFDFENAFRQRSLALERLRVSFHPSVTLETKQDTTKDTWNFAKPWNGIERTFLTIMLRTTSPEGESQTPNLENTLFWRNLLNYLKSPTCAAGSTRWINLSWRGDAHLTLLRAIGLAVSNNTWLLGLSYSGGPVEFLERIQTNSYLQELKLDAGGSNYFLDDLAPHSFSTLAPFAGLRGLTLKEKYTRHVQSLAPRLLNAHPNLERISIRGVKHETKHILYSGRRLFPGSRYAPYGKTVGRSLTSLCAATLPRSDHLDSLCLDLNDE